MQIRYLKFLFVVVCIGASCGWQGNKDQRIPVNLIGVWKTDQPRYADRPFEITKDALILEQGEGYYEFSVYPIVDVRTSNSGEKTDYVITYTGEKGLRYEFSFSYYPREGGVLELKNRQGFLWKRTTTVDNAH